MAPTHSKPVGDANEDRKKRARQHPVFDLFDSPSSKLERGEAVFKDDVVAALAAGKSLDNLSLTEMLEPAETPPKVASKPIYDFKDEDSAKKGLAANPDGYEEWLKMNVGEVESPPPAGSCPKCGRLPCIVDNEDTQEHGSAIVEAHNSQALAGADVEVKNIHFELYKMYAHALGYFKKRKELPVCVIDFVRKNFPAEDGKYVGFKAGNRFDDDYLSH